MASKKSSTRTWPGEARVCTGIKGLDEILHGGLIPGRGYLVRGGPGTGKTLLGLHFLEEGVREGETSLLVTLEETAEDLEHNAASAGINLDGVEVVDLSTDPEVFGPGQTYDVFEPDEVEADDVTGRIVEALDEIDPDRIFLDPVTLFRHLTPDPYHFRKQLLALVNRAHAEGATLLLTSQPGSEDADHDLQFVTDGTIDLGRREGFRSIEVPKFRGSTTRSGPHSFRITGDGLRVFPDLEPGVRTASFTGEQVSSGVEEVDSLLHGGIERGTSTIISGPTGVGKTTLGTQFAKEAASRGERSSIYLFEENQDTFLARSEAIGTPVGEMLDEGALSVQEIEALERSPEEIGQMIREDVEEDGAQIVMIDGIAGYRMATGGDQEALMTEMHSLVRYMKNQGVTVILVDEIRGVGQGFQATEGHVSYLADNLVILRHIELDGELHKVLGVLKKRVSDFERKLRQLEITEDGIVVGEPLKGLRGVLTGTPEYTSDGR